MCDGKICRRHVKYEEDILRCGSCIHVNASKGTCASLLKSNVSLESMFEKMCLCMYILGLNIEANLTIH
jgi:hypothetical protein